MNEEKRHRKLRAALKTLHEIFNEDGEKAGVILIVAAQQGDAGSDYGSSIADRRRVLAILKERVRVFEEQLGEAA